MYRTLCIFGLFYGWLGLWGQNPIIEHLYTADPAAMVYGDSVYLYTGHDEATPTDEGYVMNDWRIFSSSDMVNWVDHGEGLSINTFSWAIGNAWASHVVERDSQFYWYVTLSPQTDGPFAIGVAVANSPTGPFVDAIGGPLITGSMTPDLEFDIDPAVFIDQGGQAYLYWGNGGVCKMANLKANMTELDGPIQDITPPNFTEAAYLHQRGNTYYLTYAANWPETIEYATSFSPTGPFTHQGPLNARVSSTTNHQSIIEFKGQWYFIYHSADLPGGGDYRRSVCIDYLFYRPDGSIREIVQTSEGVRHADSTALCPPLALTARLAIDGQAPLDARRATLLDGEDLLLSPATAVADIGNWAWRGPQGSTETRREWSLVDLSEDQSGPYRATFTNSCGTPSYMRYDIRINPPLPKQIVSGERYALRPLDRSTVVSVANGEVGNGSNVALAPYTEAMHQQFRLTLEEEVYWRISPLHSPTRGLDVNNFSQAEGANVQIWDYWGGTTQQWQVIALGDSSYQLRARHSGKCLAHDPATSNLYQQTCNASLGQQFAITAPDQVTHAAVPTEAEQRLRLYPIPARSGQFVVDCSAIPQPDLLTITDLTGRVIFTQTTITGQRLFVDQPLPAGQYQVTVRAQGQVFTQRLLVR